MECFLLLFACLKRCLLNIFSYTADAFEMMLCISASLLLFESLATLTIIVNFNLPF